MKKRMVILLVLAMLIPMGLVTASAEETGAAAEIKPFYGLGWSDFDEEKYPNMNGLVTVAINVRGDQVSLSYDKSTSISKIAEKVTAEMNARPEGMRWLTVFGPKFVYDINDSIVYLDKGVEKIKPLIEELLRTCKELDCPLDGLTIDVEWFAARSWSIYKDVFPHNDEIYASIVEDERYATEIRPLLAERGFPFFKNPSGNISEIYSIHPQMASAYPGATEIWDTVMANRICAVNDEIFFAPLQKYYPGLAFSDYQSHESLAWNNLPDDNALPEYLGGNMNMSGNTSNMNMYNLRPGLYMWTDINGQSVYNTPESYNGAYYDATPYNFFRYDMTLFKQIYASTDTKRVSFWIAEYDFNTSGRHGVVNTGVYKSENTPYYTESILHMGLMNPEPFLVYMFVSQFTKEEYDYFCNDISQILSELTRVVGYADRKPIELPVNWNTDFVLSGMYAGGSNYWRITPDTAKVSLEDFKVDGADPTFRVSGQTVTFPGGQIIADGQTSAVGTCGYWVKTSKDVMPVITNDENRYEEYPAFGEDFESYEANWQFDVMSAEDPSAWQPKFDSKNKPTVVDNGGNKALSLSGKNTLTNANHIAQITAGDTYAKQQAWQVDITLADGQDGEIILFKTNGRNGDAKDGGFKIADGKIYYCNAGTYTELCDAKAGTYTFKRVVNFTNAENFASSYYLTDASGKEVAKAENIPMITFKIPVTGIELSTEDVTKAILVDNYKLYAVGVAADFELYDVSTGMAADAAAARTADTAYRVSWMNATAAEATATVLYDVYEGDKAVSTGTVLKEIKMAPATDGVDVGTVQVKEGQSIKVYLKCDALSVTPGTSTTDLGTEPPEGGTGTTVVTVLIVAVVAAVAVVMAAVVIAKPKKAKTEAPKEKKPEKPTEE